MHQIIFIEGCSGIGKTTLAKQLHNYFKGVYIEQHMIADFVTKDGTTPVCGKEEDETLYALMVANIKEFAKLGYKNIIALDFNPIRFRDIPNDFKGYDYLIIKLTCSNKEQNWQQMKNREANGLIDKDLLETHYRREKLYPQPMLPNQIIVDVTNRTIEEVFAIALEKIKTAKALLDYNYIMPDKKCYSTWVQADKDDV